MKRFYTLVTTHKTDHGYAVHLDGKPVKTAKKFLLIAPNEALANEIMTEWASQEDAIKPDTMPLTALLNTKIDRVSAERESMTAQVMKYLNTDLVCYRAAEPPRMKQAQENAWNPALDWFETRYKTRLETTTDLAAITHPQPVHDDVLKTITVMNDDQFTVLQAVTMDTGSIVLALMFMAGAIDADALYHAARVEAIEQGKIYLESEYSKDPHQEVKDKALMRDLTAAQSYRDTL